MANLKSKSTPRKLSSKDFEKGSPERLNRPIDTLQTPKEAIQAKNTPKTEEIADNERIRLKSIDLVAAKLPVVFTHKRHISAQIEQNERSALSPQKAEGIKLKFCDNTRKVKVTVVSLGRNQYQPNKQARGISTKGRMNKRARERVKDSIQYLGTNKTHLNLITLTQGSTNMSADEFRYFVKRFMEGLKRYIETPSKRSKRKPKDFHYVWVLEVQEQRAKETGEYALHAHIVTPNYITGQSYVNAKGEKVVQYKNGNDAINAICNKVLKNISGANYKPVYPNRQSVSMGVKNYVVKSSDGTITPFKGDKRKALSKYLTKGSSFDIKGSLYAMAQKTSKAIEYTEICLPIKAIEYTEICLPIGLGNKVLHQLFVMFETAYIYEDYVGNKVLRIYNAKGFEVIDALRNLPDRPDYELEICLEPVAITVCSPESMGEGVQKDKEQVL